MHFKIPEHKNPGKCSILAPRAQTSGKMQHFKAPKAHIKLSEHENPWKIYRFGLIPHSSELSRVSVRTHWMNSKCLHSVCIVLATLHHSVGRITLFNFSGMISHKNKFRGINCEILAGPMVLTLVGGHISPESAGFGPRRHCIRCTAIRIARLVLSGVVPRGTAEWSARVDHVR